MPTPLTIAVINASQDTCLMLEDYFGNHGWHTVALPLKDLREGRITVGTLMATRPDVIVFDVALPYAANWEAAQRLRADPLVRCPMIVTTTNERAFHQLAGAASVAEVVGTPYDLGVLRQAIVSALQPTNSVPPEVDDRRVGDRRVGERRRRSAPDSLESDDDGARRDPIQ